MKILFLTRYDKKGASSRVRTFQYLPFMKRSGFSNTISPLFSDTYLTALYNNKARWHYVLSAYFRRFLTLFSIPKYDLLLIEKELFPFLPAVFERLLNVFGIPYVVDYDDALFHRYDQYSSNIVRLLLKHKIDKVMKYSTTVVAGNDYLADRARNVGANKVEIIPTVVDLNRYSVCDKPSGSQLTIGWIGSPSTTKYLSQIVPVIERISSSYNARFVAVGAKSDALDNKVIDVWDWAEETEVTSICQFDIGIMPLPDTPWEKGKCGYKLIQYMACGLPVVASPVGVNNHIVENGVNGFLAGSPEEWYTAISKLIESAELRNEMGLRGRKKVESEYSLSGMQTRFKEILEAAVTSE